MTREEMLKKVLRSFAAYYDINTETPAAPFAAEAVFHSHTDAYFLVKSAALGEAESHEYIFFASVDQLDAPLLDSLDKTAWETGISRVKPHSSHRNTDVSLVVLASSVSREAQDAIPKMKHYKNYRLSLHGFSHYHLIVVDLSSGELTCNRQGRSLKKLFNKILSSSQKEKKERET